MRLCWLVGLALLMLGTASFASEDHVASPKGEVVWQYQDPRQRPYPFLEAFRLLPDGDLVVGVEEDEDEYSIQRRGSDGRLLWRTKLSWEPDEWNAGIVPDGKAALWVTDGRGHARALAADGALQKAAGHGRVLWSPGVSIRDDSELETFAALSQTGDGKSGKSWRFPHDTYSTWGWELSNRADGGVVAIVATRSPSFGVNLYGRGQHLDPQEHSWLVSLSQAGKPRWMKDLPAGEAFEGVAARGETELIVAHRLSEGHMSIEVRNAGDGHLERHEESSLGKPPEIQGSCNLHTTFHEHAAGTLVVRTCQYVASASEMGVGAGPVHAAYSMVYRLTPDIRLQDIGLGWLSGDKPQVTANGGKLLLRDGNRIVAYSLMTADH